MAIIPAPPSTHHPDSPDAAAHLGGLPRTISPDLITAALDTTTGHHQRRRRLSSYTVIYLLLAGVLFAEQGWRSVYRRLIAGVTTVAETVTLPAASSITTAIRRVGVEPLHRLFILLTGPAATATWRNTPANLTEYPKACRRDQWAGRLPDAAAGDSGDLWNTTYPRRRLGPDTRSELSLTGELTDAHQAGTVLTAMEVVSSPGFCRGSFVC